MRTLGPTGGVGRVSAVFSPCRTWRYRLDRDLGHDGPFVAILGVNPSDAGETANDQTIRKDIGFARRLGWGGIIKGNLFGFVSKDIKGLRAAPDPRGPENDAYLRQIMVEAHQVVAAWGPTAKLPPHLRKRWTTVAKIADDLGVPLYCFGTAQDGQPRHTLMLAYDTPLIEWKRP